MANKIQIRRGTAAQAAGVTLDAGELGWMTDTLRLIVGDGATAGGRQVLMAGQAIACTTLDASGDVKAHLNLMSGDGSGTNMGSCILNRSSLPYIQFIQAGTTLAFLAAGSADTVSILTADVSGPGKLSAGDITVATGKTLSVPTITTAGSVITFSKVINVSAGKINSGTALPASFADLAAVRTFLATAFV